MIPTAKKDLSDIERAIINDKSLLKIIPQLNYIGSYSNEIGYMGTNEKTKIMINFAVDDNGFNAGECFFKAMSKVLNKQPLDNKNEEYAIECFWHEILHVKSNNEVNLPEITSAGGRDRFIMEAVNQLVARHTYDKFLNHYGLNASFKEDILSNGYSYNQPVQQFRTLLKYAQIDELEFVSKAEILLMDSYENFDSKIKLLLAEMSGNPFIVNIANAIGKDIWEELN